MASIDGLAGMTLGKLAEALVVPKSSIQAVYRTKEDVQLAAVVAATNIFVTNVIAPAMLAFEIDAILAAANVARNFHDDDSALTMARKLIRFRLHTQSVSAAK